MSPEARDTITESFFQVISDSQTSRFSGITNILKGLKDKLHVGEGKAKTYFNAVREQYPNLMYQTNGGKWTMSKKEVEAYDNGLPFAPEPSEP